MAILAADKRLRELRDAIAAKLLRLYNRTCREDRPELGAAAFARRLELASIASDVTGGVDVIFHSGDLFADHGVQARISAKGKIHDVDLA